MKRVQQIEKSYLTQNLPEFSSGDTLRVHVKIKEGEKERIQVFQGIVIGRRGSGTGATFTVRKMSAGIGVERIFPLHSPNIDKIERIKIGSVRRAKLNYLRELTGKSARIKERIVEAEKKSTEAVAEAVIEEKAEPKLDEVPDVSETSSDSSSEDTTTQLQSTEEAESAKK
ncbi:MAG: 50S ribosomal protein L19 [candidate division Zixibacteria bacterium]|nr:50S ribosomal protein L19 [candidate division Zixibacteria bacterium]